MLGLDRGSILCARCNRAIDPKGKKNEYVTCHLCGHPKAYIFIKWQGKAQRYYAGKDGKKYTFETAFKALQDINEEIQGNRFDPDSWRTTEIEKKHFENEMATWLERKEKETEAGKLAPSTLGNYKTYNRKYYDYFLGLDVREIKLKHLQLFYDRLPGSAKYRKNILDALRTFFRWLKRWGEIDEVPIWPEMEQAISPEVWTLTYEEQQAELARIPEEHRDVFEFLMETGLRPAEACALMKIDIKFSERKGLIRHNYSEGQLTQKPKQKKEYWIVFSDRAWELITRNIGNPTPFVFWNAEYNRGYRYKVLNKVWKKYSESGVDLYAATRHSFCTMLIDDGESLKTVQGAARHADPRTTMKYIHPSDERTRQALNRRGRNSKVVPLKGDGRST